MTVTINGTTGLAGVDGSAGTPAIQGGDTNTGVFFPAADTIAFAEGGVEIARFDSSGNLGIGTSSPSFISGSGLIVERSGGTATIQVGRPDATILGGLALLGGGSQNSIESAGAKPLTLEVNSAERMRIDSSGNLLLGTTSSTIGGDAGKFLINAGSGVGLLAGRTGDGNIARWFRTNTQVGSINLTSGATSYVTSSDYRLKQDIAPMTGALAKVAALKPVTYKWKEDGSDGEGFIAHELAEVVPQCVTGDKDAVREDGSIDPQGIDTSFLVATLTAAIQEQQALITALTARITALEAK